MKIKMIVVLILVVSFVGCETNQAMSNGNTGTRMVLIENEADGSAKIQIWRDTESNKQFFVIRTGNGVACSPIN